MGYNSRRLFCGGCGCRRRRCVTMKLPRTNTMVVVFVVVSIENSPKQQNNQTKTTQGQQHQEQQEEEEQNFRIMDRCNELCDYVKKNDVFYNS